MNNYYISKSGNTESLIIIHDIELSKAINLDDFINNYKISKIFKGKFFIKRLIKKIFKYKLENQYKWNSVFWDNIKIQKAYATLSISKQFHSNNEFHNYISSSFKNKRLESIYKYQQLINKKIDIGDPLYISGNALNILGSNVEDNIIFMLDGSRRIMAQILSNNKKIKIYIMSKK